jgi:hypothetical protein
LSQEPRQLLYLHMLPHAILPQLMLQPALALE